MARSKEQTPVSQNKDVGDKAIGAFKTVKKVEIGAGAGAIALGAAIPIFAPILVPAVVFTGFEVAQYGGANWVENKKKEQARKKYGTYMHMSDAKASETTLYQGKKETPIFNRKNAGTVMEYGGAIGGLLELLELDVGGAFVGGGIWLLGRWVRYSGQEQQHQTTNRKQLALVA